MTAQKMNSTKSSQDAATVCLDAITLNLSKLPRQVNIQNTVKSVQGVYNQCNVVSAITRSTT